MSNMRVESPLKVKKVFHYDFTFSSGMQLPVTVDPAAGDTVDEGDSVIKIELAPKPSLANPSETAPAETIIVHRRYLAVMQRREREVRQLSPAELEELNQTMKQQETPPVYDKLRSLKHPGGTRFPN